MDFEAIVVGCGLTGGVVARYLAEDLGKKVLILEKRDHIAGNLFDKRDENGLLIQQYGPHTFHTKEKALFDYISRFGEWEPYWLKCMVFMCGKFTPSPFNFQTIDDFYPPEEADELKRRLTTAYPDRGRATIVELLRSEDELVSAFARFLFARDYSLYTAKQWGIAPSDIDISVLERVPVVFSYEDRYFNDDYQVMPKGGFTSFYQKLICHPNIEVLLKTDAKELISVRNGNLAVRGEPAKGPVVYTGPIDELMDGMYGYLPYRSLRFVYETKFTESFQDAPIVAYPEAEGYTRITEYTKLPEQRAGEKTVIAVEYPLPYEAETAAEPYYPILTKDSQIQYQRYRDVLERIPNLFLCGRLADFKYYNMDVCIEHALEKFEKIKKNWSYI